MHRISCLHFIGYSSSTKSYNCALNCAGSLLKEITTQILACAGVVFRLGAADFVAAIYVLDLLQKSSSVFQFKVVQGSNQIAA
jgi:hypothetical protein